MTFAAQQKTLPHREYSGKKKVRSWAVSKSSRQEVPTTQMFQATRLHDCQQITEWPTAQRSLEHSFWL